MGSGIKWGRVCTLDIICKSAAPNSITLATLILLFPPIRAGAIDAVVAGDGLGG